MLYSLTLGMGIQLNTQNSTLKTLFPSTMGRSIADFLNRYVVAAS